MGARALTVPHSVFVHPTVSTLCSSTTDNCRFRFHQWQIHTSDMYPTLLLVWLITLGQVSKLLIIIHSERHCCSATLFTDHIVHGSHCLWTALFMDHIVYGSHCLWITLFMDHMVRGSHWLWTTLCVDHIVYVNRIVYVDHIVDGP